MSKYMVEDPDTGGRKENDASQPALIPPLALLELGELYAVGATKYEPHNWARGYNYSLALNALLRHAYKYMAGEDRDPENGCHHMAAVAFHALSLIHFDGTGVGTDDRWHHRFRETVALEAPKQEPQYARDLDRLIARSTYTESKVRA